MSGSASGRLADGCFDPVVARILGDAPTFFQEHWRKRPFYAPGAGAGFAGAYGVEQFLADLVATQPVPYLSVRTQDGKRLFTKHATAEDLRCGVLAGGVSAIKASRYWHGPMQEMPESWAWMRSLFGSLCRAVSMTYMTPARSEDVDLFLAGPQSTLGTHFDTTDVFTLQIHGERKWVVEEEVHLEGILGLARDPGWYPAKEIGFQGPTREVTLRPGDAFYVPAYGVHSVTGVSWSVSLSLGLRAFNEIDFIEHLLEAVRMTHYMSYPPVASVPEPTGELHVEAKMELLRRVRSLLGQVEVMALAKLVGPLQLPAHLDSPTLAPAAGDSLPVLGMFTSGFALNEPGS